MRLLEIAAENFGIFRGATIGFGDGRFHLVCGSNEAGKSTLLQLIRETLFGFTVRNPYAFSDHEGEMAATATAQLGDGTAIRFRRRKGRVNAVQGQIDGADRGFDEVGLRGLLGSANAELYTNVFGFSLAELAAGEESLKDARLEEALYGGGVGGLANFQQTLAAIQKEHLSLFLPSGKKPPINRLSAEIREATTKLGQTMIKPRDYKEMCRHRDACTEVVAKLRQMREDGLRQQAHLDRLLQALPASKRLARAQEEAGALAVSPTFPLEAAEEFRQRRQQLQQIRDDVRNEADELAATEEELRQIHLAPELVRAEVAIQRLFQKIEQIRGCRHDIPSVAQDAESQRAGISAMLRELHPDWDLQRLDQFRTGLAQRERVRQMAEDWADLQQQATHNTRQHLEKDAAFRIDLRLLVQLKKVPPAPELEKLIRRAGQYEADRQQAGQVEDDRAALDDQIAQLRRQMAGSCDLAPAELDDLPVPLLSGVRETARRFAAEQEGIRQAEKQQQQAQRELARCQTALRQFDAHQHVPDRAALLSHRSRRDAGWRLIRQRYVEAQPSAVDEAAWLADRTQSLPDQYEREVVSADELADDRQTKAELVARREQMAGEAARQEKLVAEADDDLAKCRAREAGLNEAWLAMWRPIRMMPKSPETMLEWLGLHAQLMERLQTRSNLTRRFEEIQGRIAAFEDALVKAVGGSSDPDDLLEEARQRTEAARDAARRSADLERELPIREEELQQLLLLREETARRQALWAQHWRDLLGELGFPDEWDTRLATKALTELTGARLRYDAVHKLEKRLTEMTGTVADYERSVDDLCAKLATELQAMPAEAATSRLNQQLDEAKQAAKHQTMLLAQRQRVEQRLKTKQQQEQLLARRLDALRQQAGVDSDEDFLRLAEEAAKQKELAEEIHSLERQIEQLGIHEDRDRFLAELRQADADALAAACRQAKEATATIENEYRQAVADAAVAKKQIDDLDGKHDAAACLQKLLSDQAELKDAMNRWAPLMLADAILAQAIARFEREHQPAMLQDVGRLFAQLTAGRYVGLRRKLDETGTLVLAEANGKEKEPHQLSTGTREQLYLAIRLAYARHYCRDNEPLPLIMDDVLVNFDDRRNDAALEMLIEMARDIQVIFLTCHDETVRRIQFRLPQLEPTRLA